MEERRKNYLGQFAVNLNDEIKAGKRDPIIGRETEIRRLIVILSRKLKNNPVLIAEAGVGKTAVVEGLVRKILAGEVPDGLKGRVVYSLDLAALVAGTKLHGEFEERWHNITRQIKQSAGQIILFIDEVHLITGAGSTNVMNVSNLMKPLLTQGEFRCIGATTQAEYRRYLEGDAALERRFQRVRIFPPSFAETINILRGLKERYELFHGVRIEEDAINAAVKLSIRYITDRNLPDKAIDLLDETCAIARTNIDSTPDQLEKWGNEIMRLNLEREVELNRLKEGKNEDVRDRRRKGEIEERVIQLERSLADLNKKANELRRKWSFEKSTLNEISRIRQQIVLEENNLSSLILLGDWIKAGEKKYSLIPKLKTRLNKLVNLTKKAEVIKEYIDAEDIARTVEIWTGIKLDKIMEKEREKLISLPIILSEKIKGQSKAVTLVSDAIWKYRSGIKDVRYPVGSFLFIGTTGVGKTETARALASVLFDTEDALVRFDMSEFSDRHSTSKLIGTPPGYIGFEQRGRLTEEIRVSPFSVLLFDEVEKAHQDVLHILLQVLSDGRLSDNHGRMVDFKNTIIIMTSNISFNLYPQLSSLSEKDGSVDRISLIKNFIPVFTPEMINRINEVVVFNSLTRVGVLDIISLELKKLTQRILENKKFVMEFDSKVPEIIFSRSYNEVFGARSVQQFIRREIESVIAREIIRGVLKEGFIYFLYWDSKDEVFMVQEKEVRKF